MPYKENFNFITLLHSDMYQMAKVPLVHCSIPAKNVHIILESLRAVDMPSRVSCLHVSSRYMVRRESVTFVTRPGSRDSSSQPVGSLEYKIHKQDILIFVHSKT